MRNILITGSSGMVAYNFLKFLSKKPDIKLFGADLNSANFEFCENIKADITNMPEVMNLKELNPDIIIHCAALTNIADCEKNSDLAYKINVEGTKNIVELAKITKAKLVYLSTDAVFDGEKGDYVETDIPNPSTVYGETKWKGEEECLKYDNSIVIRTNIFGKNHSDKKGFLESVLFNLSEGKNYNAFIDVKNTPIYVSQLIKIIMNLIDKDAAGIFHVVGNDNLTRYELAKLAAKIFNYDENLIKESSVDSISEQIKYAKNLTLNNTKLLNLLKITIPLVEEMILEFKEDK